MSTLQPKRLRWKATVKYGSELCFTSKQLAVRRDQHLLSYDLDSGVCCVARELKGSSIIGYRLGVLNDQLLITWQDFHKPAVIECISPAKGETLFTLELPGEKYAQRGDLLAVIIPGRLTLYRLCFAPAFLETLWEVPCSFDPAPARSSLEPLLMEIDPDGARIAASQDYVGIVWSTQDGSVVWRGDAMLQHTTQGGFLMQRVVGRRPSYEVDLFDPYGYLLRTFLDPRCAKNDPDRYNVTYRGYFARRSSGRYIVFGARWFSRSAGFNETELFLFDQSSGRFEEVKDASSISPCEDEALVGGYGRLWALDDPTSILWSVTSKDWKRFGLEQRSIQRLAPQGGRLYGLSTENAFCLEP